MIGDGIVTREQKELLYNIANWRSKEFYNNMEDHWTSSNYEIDAECNATIRKLEKEYKEKYGDLPEWKYIDDVWDARDNLKKELEENI